MVKGETVDIKSKEFTISCVKPCGTEEGKVMAEARLKIPRVGHGRMFQLLRKRFPRVRQSSDIRAARLEWKGRVAIVFDSGEVYIRKAEDRDDAVRIVRLLYSILKPRP